MSIYDDMYQNVNNRQQKAREWENIRSNARRDGRTGIADDALDHLGGIEGLSPTYLSGLHKRATGDGDTKLADLARKMMNKAASNQSADNGSSWN